MSLQVPKYGYSTVNAFTREEEEGVIVHVGMKMPSWKKILGAPFYDDNTTPADWQLASVFITIILVFLGALINGWVLVAARYAATLAADGLYIKTLVIAVISACVFYVTSLWTYDPKLPNVVLPEFAMAMVGTGHFGVITALAYTVVSWGGFLAAGGILKALGYVSTNVAPLINYPTSNNTYWLYWFGGTVIVFSYVFNFHFRQTGGNKTEKLTHAHRRASLAAGLAIFLLTVGFSTGIAAVAPFTGLNGIYTFSSGQYFAGWVINWEASTSYLLALGTVGTNAVLGVNPPAFFILVAWLAVPGTVVALIILLVVINYAGTSADTRTKAGYVKQKDTVEMAEETAPTASAVRSERLVRRQVAVNYN